LAGFSPNQPLLLTYVRFASGTERKFLRKNADIMNEASKGGSVPESSSEQHVSSSYARSSPLLQPIVDHHNRLSRPGPARMMFYFSNGVCIFWVIGFLRARRLAAHQFLAENSHRLPTSDAGWYLYHRAKNYQVVWRGFKGAFRYGAIGGACAFLYGFVEEAWDQGVRKGRVDPGGSTVAGTATAGAFAIWNRMRTRQAWRCLRVGMECHKT
jgi:hypothetical protein